MHLAPSIDFQAFKSQINIFLQAVNACIEPRVIFSDENCTEAAKLLKINVECNEFLMDYILMLNTIKASV